MALLKRKPGRARESVKKAIKFVSTYSAVKAAIKSQAKTEVSLALRQAKPKTPPTAEADLKMWARVNAIYAKYMQFSKPGMSSKKRDAETYKFAENLLKQDGWRKT